MWPTWSMSFVRKHFWHEVMRCEGGSAEPRKYAFSGCMPAIVRRTEGSSSYGIRDADGSRLWPWRSKYSR